MSYSISARPNSPLDLSRRRVAFCAFDCLAHRVVMGWPCGASSASEESAGLASLTTLSREQYPTHASSASPSKATL